ncbi:hypothetical protein Cni_G07764 [Canna indica]|uniref:PWWP domain-containing protein n=1 Tax=Canna indica TaxID=4628 RepID=A0AAQ3Q7N2_9LILI|nr:hypothetical protein Cni_G07764 [Canna indica]
MGVSEDGDGGGTGVDCTVGTIVWVRRRNGSWWPGRILGPEELSVSHLMSPRSGTPVKLLGREDASVDWYNLEKSKRVKSFRCGEFDACIEKAEASLGVPIKKREKYARREDAILHALELERKQLEMNQLKQPIISGGVAGNSLGAVKREFKNLSSLDTVTRNVDSSMHSKYFGKSPTVARKPDSLDEEENQKSSVNINEGKNTKQIGWEEDTSGAIHRVRGHKDFGLRIAPKKKLPQSFDWSVSKEPAGNSMDVLPSSGHLMRGRGHVSSGNDTLSIKIKKSHGSLVEEPLAKKRDRRRPILQVLQSSAKLQDLHSSQFDHYPDLAPMQEEMDHLGVIRRAKRSRCIYLPSDSIDSHDDDGNSSDDMQTRANQFEMDNFHNQPDSLIEDCTSSGMIETNESDSSPRHYLESETEEGDIYRDTGQLIASRQNNHDSSISHYSEKSGDMDNNEVPFSRLYSYENSADASADVGISKWHMKGKRNNRSLVKRPVDVGDGKLYFNGSDRFDGSATESAYGAKCSGLRLETIEPFIPRNVEQGFHHIKKEENYAFEDDLIGEDIFQGQMNGYNNQRYPSVSKSARDLGRSHIAFNNMESDSHLTSISWEADGRSQGAWRKCWEESDECYDNVYAPYISREFDSNLFDVNLKVKASYQGEHVPFVSLMSRLNGKAIIGHPVQIEILEDGSTDQYFPSNYGCPDERTTHQPVWRTARRTAMQRFPRTNPLTSSWDDDEPEGSHYSERDNKPSPDIYVGHFKNQSRSTKKRVLSAYRPPLGNLQKKSQKRASLSSQKTRTLSSFGSEHRLSRQNGEARLARGSSLLSGLMKSDGQVPLVTCVPVKVAFSRILEAVRRS